MNPISIWASSNGPSLCDLPAEIRLDICDAILDLSNIPRSYGYTAPLHIPHKTALHTHGMLLVNQAISAEYRQAFYERTKFFFRIDSHNAFRGIPELALQDQAQGQDAAETAAGLPNFWDAPDALLANLRHCTLFVEIGEVACHRQSAHSLSVLVRPSAGLRSFSPTEAPTLTSDEDVAAKDAAFDAAFVAAVHKLLDGMLQLRSVQLVWETTPGIRSYWETLTGDWTWEGLGEPFLEILMGKRLLREALVKVGDKENDLTRQAKRVEGKWMLTTM